MVNHELVYRHVRSQSIEKGKLNVKKKYSLNKRDKNGKGDKT